MNTEPGQTPQSSTVGDDPKQLRQRWAPALRFALAILAVAITIPLAIAPRKFNHEEILTKGLTLFVDGDCYARMIRARDVYEHPGKIVREHKFENWPDGTKPHTTAPMDYFIAGIAAALPESWCEGRTRIDMAGALVGPILGALAAAFLAVSWVLFRLRHGWAAVLLFAVSPALAWATVLGRPDHQALLVLFLTIAISMELWMLLARTCGLSNELIERAAPWIAGGAWGLALWTSLFEPVILGFAFLLAAIATEGLAGARRRLPEWIFGGAILCLSFVIEGVRITLPGADPAFANWARLIPELSGSRLVDIVRWGGWVVVAVPILFIYIGARGLAARAPGWRGWFSLAVVAIAVISLGLWQQRWTAYSILCCVLMLPWGLQVLPRGMLAGAGYAIAVILSLWPAAAEWEALVYPSETRAAALRERREEARVLHTIASGLRENAKGDANAGVLAPYWMGPSLAYWGNVPVMGSTSHQSLPGILASAEFFLADELLAEKIVRAHKVGWVLAYDSGRTMATSQIVLNRAAGSGACMGRILDGNPGYAPAFLEPSVKLGPFVLYRVRPELVRGQ
jgi:hypothetical protein